MSERLEAVDDYIAKRAAFAQPILHHLREAVHRAVPEIKESIKWSRPFFIYRGVILGNIAGFKEHCSFGLWGAEMASILRSHGVDGGEGMGSFGRITSLADLPPADQLDTSIRHAAQLIRDGVRTRSIQRVAKPSRTEVEILEALETALRGHRGAAANFAKLSPSCRREYAVWIASAKREETRTRRAAAALEWIAAGKCLNWKYDPVKQHASG